MPGWMDEREARIALNMVDHVGPIRLRQLLQHFGTAPAVLGASVAELLRVPGIGPDTAHSIHGWEKSVDLAAEMAGLARVGCRVLIPSDSEYPPLLREIYDPPIVLYVRGQLTTSDHQSIALVGSRQTTAYGVDAARRLAYQLAYAGVTVVSGGARGIDTAAHQGALQAKGRTIAVLGTGMNFVFPPENSALFDRIAENGAVVTQFSLNRPADKQTFPIRNRIVAGMTLGTVVVEARLASGALITTNFATEYGRQVFAVPGRIDSPSSKGCHDLIKNGAKLCENLEDILSEFEYLFPEMGRKNEKPQEENESDSPGNPASRASETRMLPGLELPSDEAKILELLGVDPQSADALIERSEMSAQTVQVALFNLELKRLARQFPGKLYARK